jgi:hypothetical protein
MQTILSDYSSVPTYDQVDKRASEFGNRYFTYIHFPFVSLHKGTGKFGNRVTPAQNLRRNYEHEEGLSLGASTVFGFLGFDLILL